jgi:hypothetical protein
MSDLSVNVNRNDIVVSKPSSGLSVTYRRTGRVLVALDSMRRDPKGEELMFLVRAWNAAFAKAQSLGWLNWSKHRVVAEVGTTLVLKFWFGGWPLFLDISGNHGNPHYWDGNGLRSSPPWGRFL